MSKQNKHESRNQLSVQKEEAVMLHLQGMDNAEIARKLGCTRQTIYNWLGEPDIVALVNARRKARRQAHIEQSDELASCTLRALIDYMKSSNPDPVVAFKVLAGLGFLTGELSPIGTSDPRVLRLEEKLTTDLFQLVERKSQPT